MIAERPLLERLGYSKAELDALDQIRVVTARADADDLREIGPELLKTLWPSEKERVQKTTVILTKRRGPKLLRFNYAQERFWDDVIEASRSKGNPIRAIILKGRQLGYSTLIQALHYFWCNENPFRNAITVSYDDPSSRELFFKAKYIHESHFFPRKTRRDSGQVLEFSQPHSSRFIVRTAGNLSAGRGDTFHHFHASEIPFWPNAEEVMTGLQQAVVEDTDTSIIWESTAKGAQGLFYDTWESAMQGRGFQPFFAPWFWDPEYTLPFGSDADRRRFSRDLSHEDKEYMERYSLSLEQMKWRRHTIDTRLSGNERKWQQEYPATATEAFLTSGSPVFNARRVTELLEEAVAPIWRGECFLA